VICQGPYAAVEWKFEFEAFGKSVKRKQIALQFWNNSLIEREDFYYHDYQ
jgi:hypothetical protein